MGVAAEVQRMLLILSEDILECYMVWSVEKRFEVAVVYLVQS